MERHARIFNIQKYNVHDGPGVRTLIFFKGCPLRCKWCSNPEGLVRGYQVMYKKNLCVHCGACTKVCPASIHQMDAAGKHYVRRDVECIGCRKCEKACLYGALQIKGEDASISSLIDKVEEDRDFYFMSGGGMTLGGGEVTAQPEAAKSLLMAARSEGFHTAIETCGYTNPDTMLEMANHIDLFLFDIKHMDPVRHKELTGVNNEKILHNLKNLLEQGKNVQVRMPLLKGINDSKEEIFAVIEFLDKYKYYKNFKGVDLLPYHKLGVGKYDQLDMEYPIEGDPSLSDESLMQIERWLSEADFPVKLIRH